MEYRRAAKDRFFLGSSSKGRLKAERDEARCRADIWRNTLVNSPHKLSLEKFEAYGTLRLTIPTTNFKPNSTPDKLNTNPHIAKHLAEGRHVYL